MHRILTVFGSRPEIVQSAPLSLAFANRVEEVLVHTGQHYDPELSEIQIADLRLPLPDYNLGVGSLPNGQGVAAAQERLAKVIERERPDAVLVIGGTNAALAGARAAVAAGVRLLHVEAGVRSYRRQMPEEGNRLEIDRAADVLLAPTESAGANLLGERARGSVHVVGDLLADALSAARERLPERSEAEDYVLATVHRNFNTDSPERLSAVLGCLAMAGCRVIFPAHPRTTAALERWNLEVPPNVELRPPLKHSEMLALERDAFAIATDSSGVQREAYLWGVPCIAFREETEWPETVAAGWNTLVGVDPERFRAALREAPPLERPEALGDGQAARRVADVAIAALERSLEESAA